MLSSYFLLLGENKCLKEKWNGEKYGKTLL